MFVEHKITVGTEHVGAHGTLTNRSITDFLCNAADVHSHMIGQSMYDGISPVAWILMGWVVNVYSRPRPRDTVTVRTWMQKSDRIFSDRDFEIRNESGELIVSASSRWMAIDVKRGMITRLTPEILAPYQAEPEAIAVPDAVFMDANRFDLPALSAKEFTVMHSMIDGYGHVHNTAYADIAMEALPDELADREFTHFEICYKKEIKPAAKVKLEYCKNGEDHYAVMRSPEDNKIHAIVMFR